MTLLFVSPHLTRSDIDYQAAKTHAGMAFFAGSGPGGKTCRECSHWNASSPYPKRYSSMGKLLKPCACLKYKQMMQGSGGPEVPADASACKYFEENPKPPLIRPSTSEY